MRAKQDRISVSRKYVSGGEAHAAGHGVVGWHTWPETRLTHGHVCSASRVSGRVCQPSVARGGPPKRHAEYRSAANVSLFLRAKRWKRYTV